MYISFSGAEVSHGDCSDGFLLLQGTSLECYLGNLVLLSSRAPPVSATPGLGLNFTSRVPPNEGGKARFLALTKEAIAEADQLTKELKDKFAQAMDALLDSVG